jgi:predicted enzyme related to lactoylglutathione lyase
MERVSDGSRETESPVFRPAGISYLRIPSDDPKRTAAFLDAVFGWKVDADRDDPSFEDGTGHVIGHIDGRMEVAGKAGNRPYVYVESVDRTLEKVTGNDGAVVTPPYPEGDLTVAVFREPGGSVLGLWQLA